MSDTALLAIALLILVWAVFSGALGRHAVTGPIVFTVAGFLLANPHWGPIAVDIDSASLHALAELTLALVLFGDASRINLVELRHDLAIPVRLLAIGLPLSIVAGGLLAGATFDAMPWALAGFIGAALAPTDAALSVQVIKDARIPLRLRRGLNVESGLNDGIATPVVVFMLAVAAGQLGLVTAGPATEGGAALWELARGIAAGLVVGWGGALLVDVTAAKDWIGGGGRRIATLAIGLAAFLAATVDRRQRLHRCVRRGHRVRRRAAARRRANRAGRRSDRAPRRAAGARGVVPLRRRACSRSRSTTSRLGS